MESLFLSLQNLRLHHPHVPAGYCTGSTWEPSSALRNGLFQWVWTSAFFLHKIVTSGFYPSLLWEAFWESLRAPHSIKDISENRSEVLVLLPVRKLRKAIWHSWGGSHAQAVYRMASVVLSAGSQLARAGPQAWRHTEVLLCKVTFSTCIISF